GIKGLTRKHAKKLETNVINSLHKKGNLRTGNEFFRLPPEEAKNQMLESYNFLCSKREII
ncbi:MAG: hypothetical protein KAQ98_04750, partial [Bacteriovoracaceae bacterium]|nr:hypothetical protein [Bacteriovoracaceae bacterium]